LSQPQLTSPAYVRNGSEIALRRTTEQCRRNRPSGVRCNGFKASRSATARCETCGL